MPGIVTRINYSAHHKHEFDLIYTEKVTLYRKVRTVNLSENRDSLKSPFLTTEISGYTSENPPQDSMLPVSRFWTPLAKPVKNR